MRFNLMLSRGFAHCFRSGAGIFSEKAKALHTMELLETHSARLLGKLAKQIQGVLSPEFSQSNHTWGRSQSPLAWVCVGTNTNCGRGVAGRDALANACNIPITAA